MASRYDDELWELVPADPGPPPAHLVDFVRGLGHVGRALDLGCGDGRLTVELDAAELTAADVSRVAVERARARLPGARVVELEPDAALPFADGSFELVLTTPASPPLARPEHPLSPHLRRFTRRTLRRVLDELGFDVRSLRRRSGTLLARAVR